MGKGPEQTILQGGHTEGPDTYERMFNITSHQKDANENHNEIPLHTCQNGHHKQINKTSAGEVMEKREPECIVGGNADWCSHCGKQYGIS